MEKIGIAWSFCFSGIWYWLQDQFPNTEVASVLEAVLMAVNQILGMYLVVVVAEVVLVTVSHQFSGMILALYYSWKFRLKSLFPALSTIL